MTQKDLKPIYSNCVTVSPIMRVGSLKKILSDLPDDMIIVIPDSPRDIVTDYITVGSAEILDSAYEGKKVLCLRDRYHHKENLF